MSENSMQSVRRLRAIGVVLALMGMVASGSALACAVRVGPVTTAAITYDPFVTANVEGLVRVDVDLVEGDSCDAVLVLTDDSAAPLRTLGFGPRGDVLFRPLLQRDAGVRDGTDPAEALITLTTASPHAEIAWRLVGEGDGLLSPGDYSVPVRVQLRTPLQSTPPSIGAVALRSIARAQINLAGASVPFEAGSDAATIDLGELRTGGSGRAFVQLRANTQARLSFVSEHRGHLVGPSGGRIAYRASLDGVDLDLAQAATRAVDPPLTLRGSALELIVTVGDVTGAAAGRYSDTIVIDVSP